MESKPKVTDGTGNKKFKMRDLPQDIDHHFWRRTFVPTFMMNVARLDNPFDHNIKAGCAAMQKIWDLLFDDTPYTIIHSSPVYQLVRYLLLVSEGFYLFTDHATRFRLVAQHHGLNSHCSRPCLL